VDATHFRPIAKACPDQAQRRQKKLLVRPRPNCVVAVAPTSLTLNLSSNRELCARIKNNGDSESTRMREERRSHQQMRPRKPRPRYVTAIFLLNALRIVVVEATLDDAAWTMVGHRSPVGARLHGLGKGKTEARTNSRTTALPRYVMAYVSSSGACLRTRACYRRGFFQGKRWEKQLSGCMVRTFSSTGLVSG